MEDMSLSSFKCPWCESSSVTLRGLSVHIRRHPEKTTQDLYDALYHSSGRPTCKCGCGEAVRFMDVGRGYSEFAHGHAARVNNNWGHNDEARKKSQQSRRESYQRGEWHGWCKGLDKSDEKIALMAEKVKVSINSNLIELQNRSNRMRQQRADGTTKSPSGEQHGRWKDGLSSLNNLAHSYVYNAWSRPKMKEGNFACKACGETKDICVHHDKERFSDLLRQAALDVGWDRKLHARDFEMKSKVAQRLADIHVERDVSGVVLCRECHARAHEELGEVNEASVIRSRAVD